MSNFMTGLLNKLLIYSSVKQAAAVITALFMSLSLSGCATALYMKGKPTDWKMETWVETVPLKSGTPYLKVSRVTTRTDRYIYAANDIAFIGALLMEFTPLGFAAPLFGYPDIIEQDIVGEIAVKLSRPVENVEVEGGTKKRDSITFEFPTNGIASGVHRVRLRLRQGVSTKVIPPQVDYNVYYNKTSCHSETVPDVISDDGLIPIQIDVISDELLR
jgi:hypothetical protein